MVELRIKVGKKGQILVPKILRQRYGINEGSYVHIEPREDGILLKGRPSPDEILSMLEQHLSKLRSSGIKGPRPGELGSTYLEIEFEDKTH